MLKIILLSLFIFPIFSSLATPMNEGDKQAFIVSSKQACYKNTRESIAYKSLTDSQIGQYCSCYANKASVLITNEDLSKFTQTNDISIFNKARKEATNYCDTKAISEWKWNIKSIIADMPADKVNMNDYKEEYIKGFMGTCNRGGFSIGKFDSIIDKILTKTKQDNLCTCQANKSLELLTFDKIKKLIATGDKLIIDSELKASVDFCMKKENLISAKELLAIGFANKCTKDMSTSSSNYSNYEIETQCYCQGKRIADKLGSLKRASEMAEDKRKSIVNEVLNYCERNAY